MKPEPDPSEVLATELCAECAIDEKYWDALAWTLALSKVLYLRLRFDEQSYQARREMMTPPQKYFARLSGEFRRLDFGSKSRMAASLKKVVGPGKLERVVTAISEGIGSPTRRARGRQPDDVLRLIVRLLHGFWVGELERSFSGEFEENFEDSEDANRGTLEARNAAARFVVKAIKAIDENISVQQCRYYMRQVVRDKEPTFNELICRTIQESPLLVEICTSAG